MLRRLHMSPRTIQKAVTAGGRKPAITKRAPCHTLRHFSATHLLAAGYDIGTVQELFGHRKTRRLAALELPVLN